MNEFVECPSTVQERSSIGAGSLPTVSIDNENERHLCSLSVPRSIGRWRMGTRAGARFCLHTIQNSVSETLH